MVSVQQWVMTAVMPKGVEHLAAAIEKPNRCIVITAVMPKGVEHSLAKRVFLTVLPVMTAVMPKGVEHTADDPALGIGRRK